MLAGSSFIGGNRRWRCVTYIQQLQMHLFCLEAASARLLSLSFPLFFLPSSFHLMLSRSPRPLTWCIQISVDQPLQVPPCQTSSYFWRLPSPMSLLNPFISCLAVLLVSTCVGVRPQPWRNDKAVLICMWGKKTTFPRILLFLSKVVIKLIQFYHNTLRVENTTASMYLEHCQ